MRDSIGITVATHGWIGTEMARGKIMVEEGAEMQWKEEREVSLHCMAYTYIHTYPGIEQSITTLYCHSI